MKFIVTTLIAIAAAVSFAQDHCQTKTDCKMEAKVAKQDCCAKKLEAKVEKEKDCCKEKLEAKMEKDCCKQKLQAKVEGDCGSCEKGAKKGGYGMHANHDEEFMAEAHRMMMAAEGKKGDACCKSTASKPMMKGDKGCCNEHGQQAKFKVYVAGVGYKYFGCEGSAKKGAAAHSAKGHKVGRVQKVTSKSTRIA